MEEVGVEQTTWYKSKVGSKAEDYYVESVAGPGIFVLQNPKPLTPAQIIRCAMRVDGEGGMRKEMGGWCGSIWVTRTRSFQGRSQLRGESLRHMARLGRSLRSWKCRQGGTFG